MEEPESAPTPAVTPGAGAQEPAVDSTGAFHMTVGAGDVIAVTGELDAHSAARLRTALAQAFDAGPEVVVVDLSEITFIDSVGLSVLVTAHNRGESQGISFEVRGSSPACRRVFEITRLVDVLRLT